MASFVYIELDTRPPTVEIFAPSYTTTEIVNTIQIKADETVSNFQDIFAIDENNTRYDYTFVKTDDNLFFGEINFFNFPLGIVTIYATLKDEVDNISNTASTTILIRENLTLLKLTISDSIRKVSIDNRVQELHINDSSINIDINNSCRNIEVSDIQREVFTDVR